MRWTGGDEVKWKAPGTYIARLSLPNLPKPVRLHNSDCELLARRKERLQGIVQFGSLRCRMLSSSW